MLIGFAEFDDTFSSASPLEHDPEKWEPKRSCSNKKLDRDNDSKKSHPDPEVCCQNIAQEGLAGTASPFRLLAAFGRRLSISVDDMLRFGAGHRFIIEERHLLRSVSTVATGNSRRTTPSLAGMHLNFETPVGSE